MTKKQICTQPHYAAEDRAAFGTPTPSAAGRRDSTNTNILSLTGSLRLHIREEMVGHMRSRPRVTGYLKFRPRNEHICWRMSLWPRFLRVH
jgi:hypothetical protein